MSQMKIQLKFVGSMFTMLSSVITATAYVLIRFCGSDSDEISTVVSSFQLRFAKPKITVHVALSSINGCQACQPPAYLIPFQYYD